MSSSCWRCCGNLGAAYRDEKVSLPPEPRVAHGCGRADGGCDVANALSKALGPLTRTAVAPPIETKTCGEPWPVFCDAMANAITFARSRGQQVLVVNQPYMSDRHVLEQAALRGMLRQRFATDAGVRYVDLGWAVDLKNRALAYDGAHLTPAGNDQIAAHLVEPVVTALNAATSSASLAGR